jgi:hypothetical protein
VWGWSALDPQLRPLALTQAVGNLCDAHVLSAHGDEVEHRGVVATLGVRAEELMAGKRGGIVDAVAA